MAAALCGWRVRPVLGVSKEIVQMQQQLDTLQQLMLNMQKTLDTQTAVLRTLIEQANDNVNSMKATVADLQKTDRQNLASANSRFDSMNNQLQALSESLEEAKSRISKLNDQIAQTQNIIQTLNRPPAASDGAAGGANGPNGAVGNSAASPPAPDPETLYKSAYGDYTTGRYDLAIAGFEQYVQLFPETDLASNAQFYIGDSYYDQQKYEQAIEAYNACMEKYPDGNKTAAAQLKKGYALLSLGRTAAGERELRALVRRFPSSHEAALANQKLRGVSRSASR